MLSLKASQFIGHNGAFQPFGRIIAAFQPVTCVDSASSSLTHFGRFNSTFQHHTSLHTLSTGLSIFSRGLVTHTAPPDTAATAETLPENVFTSISEDWLDALTCWLEDNDPGFEEIEYHDGVLTFKIPDGMTFVVNRQTPNRELWLSSPVRGPSHFQLYSVDGRPEWIESKTGSNLHAVLEEDVSKLLGVEYPIVIE
ncbi:Frataxin [Carpediemonas membranifera]|uniref:Frataxin n=1 Tax=Carpediemonas membranifera TaxID=201153 RepID=A0A8J6DZJ1_9EUKA|nr:Frataxin [Carpediemonas membranifera]|eukprot:KAG9390788.1 Frataxin [Carpediemonas membranifera]